MHKRLVSECLIDLEIRPEGPLLIKSGIPNPDGPDMAPVETLRTGNRPEVYIPGSSLKGVLRSHAERIARTLAGETPGGRGSCNPFGNKEPDVQSADGACGAKLERRKPLRKNWKPGAGAGPAPDEITPTVAYRDSCPICKVFGSTVLLGRMAVPDAYTISGYPGRRERRDGVGIDRVTGGSSSGAKFDFEVVVGARFRTRLRLSNFELWQLGLLGLVLHDMGEGLVPLGSGRSRGLGDTTAEVLSVQVRYAANLMAGRAAGRLYGLSALQAGDRETYGYWTGEAEGREVAEMQPWNDGLGLRCGFEMEAGSVPALWRALAEPAIARLQSDRLPDAMRLAAAGAGP